MSQLSFAAFHFFVTWLTLYTLSRPRFAMFVPRRVAVKEIIPLAIAMSLNVILPNLSLAFSTVTFYQVARILLTPCVAAMNFVLYKATLPRGAIYALVPACLGVGMVSYYDSLPSADANIKTTSTLGVIFAFSGIFASSLYTVWISSYHKKLQMNSMQLLFNQAPLAAFMLLYIIPFVDTFPVWTEVPFSRWLMILMVCFLIFCYSLLYLDPQRPPRAKSRNLANRIFPVRLLRLHHQHVPILHHRPNRSCLQHRRRPRKDLLYRRDRLDHLWPRCWRQIHHWRVHRHRRHHRVRTSLFPAHPKKFMDLSPPCWVIQTQPLLQVADKALGSFGSFQSIFVLGPKVRSYTRSAQHKIRNHIVFALCCHLPHPNLQISNPQLTLYL